jgi:hypothetical protein
MSNRTGPSLLRIVYKASASNAAGNCAVPRPQNHVRAVIAGLVILVVAGGLVGRQAVTHWIGHHALRDPIVDGYVVRLDAQGAVLGPGTSLAPGERIGFALNALRAGAYVPTITDAAGRVVATLPTAQIAPHEARSAAPWLEGSDYPIAFSWVVPTDFAGGVYCLGGLPDLFFIVREAAAARAPIVVLLPTNTLNAYSTTLGRSLYKQPTMVTAVSFLRPQSPDIAGQWLAFVRWILAERPFGAVNVTYIADADMENGQALQHARVLIVLGHSEYWTRRARETFDAYVARGGDVVIAGGNVMWWQTRIADDRHTMIVYRSDKPAKAGGDPVPDPNLRTVRWNNPKLAYPTVPSIGGDFAFGGYGQRGDPDGSHASRLTVVSGATPLLAGTGLGDCEPIDYPTSTEWDGAPIVGLDASGRPVPDRGSIGAARFELLAYEWHRNGARYTLGTMHLMQRTPTSGSVLHLGARECCMTDAFYTDAGHGLRTVQRILSTAVATFLNGSDPFSPDATARAVAFPMTTPWLSALPPVSDGPCAPHVGSTAGPEPAVEAEAR